MVYFVRHGESEANVKQVFAGQRDDCPLTEKGVGQAHEVVADIQRKQLKLERIICSPLQRTHKTAIIIAQDLGLSPTAITIDPRVAEYDMGSLTGTPMNATSAELIAPDDAEDVHGFQRRVMAALREAAALPGNTLVVSHAGVGKVIEATRLHHVPHIFYDLDGYPHGQVVELGFLAAIKA
jgi:broad specificity phosphatase PhoE